MSNNINRIHSLEKAFVFYMNTMYDWNLNWTGEGMSNWMLKALQLKETNALLK